VLLDDLRHRALDHGGGPHYGEEHLLALGTEGTPLLQFVVNAATLF